MLKRFAASPDAIWGAANQICLGLLGLVRNEILSRKKNVERQYEPYVILPVLLTNASLSVCELSSQSIELMTGNHKGDMKTVAVDWVILHHPFTPDEASGSSHLGVVGDYADPELRGAQQKHGIVVLNAGAIRSFLEVLWDLKSFEAKVPSDEFSRAMDGIDDIVPL